MNFFTPEQELNIAYKKIEFAAASTERKFEMLNETLDNIITTLKTSPDFAHLRKGNQE
jgi:hypothetical protein